MPTTPASGDPFRLSVNGQVLQFEMHRVCGPVVVNRCGQPLATQPGPRHRFWTAVTLWAQQGRRVEDGWCVWDEPPEPILKHCGGRHYQVVGFRPAVRGA